MRKLKFVYWKDDGWWLGYLQDYPNYWTQGEDLNDLKEHLRDIYQEVLAGTLSEKPAENAPGARRIGQLDV